MNRETYKKAEKIQSRSLDTDIKSRKPGAIIEQKTKIKKDNEEVDIDLDIIIQSEDSYILPAMVGSGKSLWATSLVKKIITEYPEKQVIFFEGFEGEGWSKKDVNTIEAELLGKIKSGNNTILVIDAFDEIGTDIDHKNKIFELLKKLKQENEGLKIVITGRPSEFHETKND